MTVLVTGGAGFVGSHLVDELVARDERVVVVDDLSTGREENLAPALSEGAQLVRETITDAAGIAGVIEDHRPERVFHLAAQIDVRRSVDDPAFDASINVLGTLKLLEALRRFPPRTMVFASTGGAIYGEGADRQLPLSENAECFADSPYGQSKLAAEGYVDLYRRAYGIPGVSLRLGNVYGPRQNPDSEAGVIAIFCGKLMRGERPTVFGDGVQTRDYVYVDDVVEAMLAAEAVRREGGPGQDGPYNVGTGRETSVLELIELLRRVGGRSDLDPVMAPPRQGEVQRISLDSARAGRELGWRPAVGLEDGLERTLDAMREGEGLAGDREP
jgi:UDP-glucose 4-epimerase